MGLAVPGTLTFDQVKKARVFAWHERHYVYANDTLLRVLARYPDSDDEAGPLPGMVVRPSSLRGTERLLDQGWHHLDGCSCSSARRAAAMPTVGTRRATAATTPVGSCDRKA